MSGLDSDRGANDRAPRAVTRSMRSTLLACAILARVACAFYLPVSPAVDYGVDQKVPLTVNKITSTRTQLPYDYYDLPVCRGDQIEDERESLGEILTGDRIHSTAFVLEMKRNAFCKVLCRKEFSTEDIALLKLRIAEEYKVHYLLDNLPAVIALTTTASPGAGKADTEAAVVHYERGYPLGASLSPSPNSNNPSGVRRFFLFNHVRFIVDVQNEAGAEDSKWRVVGFQVEPYSVKHRYEGRWPNPGSNDPTPQLTTCNDAHHVTASSSESQSVDEPGEVIFTYDVEWRVSDVKWANRWDLYLQGVEDAEVHWFSILNSVIIVLFLTGMIAMIMMRVLHVDITRINDESYDDEIGWKLVHGDVFRPPAGFFGPMFLSVFVGSGVQILMMALSVMVFAVLGVLSPANRGGLLTALLLLFIFMGSFAGYASSRVYKMFHGKAWKRNTLLTALSFPSTVAVGVLFMNFFVMAEHSTAAIPFTTMVALSLLWFGVSLPLVFLGSYLGFTRDAVKPPVRVNTFSRMVPPQPWYLHPLITCLAGGVLPFGAVFIELYFIMTSIWQAQVYYVFGFLALVLLILIITCAEISIVMCYFQLCSEDYHWWWRSFLTAGSSAVWVFVYSIVYFVTKLQIENPTSTLLYFGYMSMISWMFFLLTGAIGFMATLFFVRYIFSQIRIE